MPPYTTSHELRALLSSQKEFALLDVRDAGSYNSAHIPGSSLLPRHRIEYDLSALVPFRGAPLVFCDDAGQQASLAAVTAERMGYSRVSVLEGGINRWTSLDFPTEWGTNVLSKDFGERVEVEHRVPEIDSIELKRRIDSGEKLVIMDTRTPEEFRNFSIPGGRSVPNGELALHVTDILNEHGPDSTVILNCAGRTRSIIGTRALQRMGVPRVLGLKNGTAGWVLSGLELETGADSLSLPPVSAEGEALAADYAERAAEEDGVRFMDFPELKAVMARAQRGNSLPGGRPSGRGIPRRPHPRLPLVPRRSGRPAGRRRGPRAKRPHRLRLRRAGAFYSGSLLVSADGLSQRLRPPQRRYPMGGPGSGVGGRYAEFHSLWPSGSQCED